MPHPLEQEFDLSAAELLDAVSQRFRARVTLEGAVAEVHLGKHIKDLCDRGLIARSERHDEDGYPDYSIWLPGNPDKAYRVECKNARNSNEAYREDGKIVAYKVETQKTRASQGDPSSRYYSFNQFEILAVCLGKKTHNWRQFMFIQPRHLTKHAKFDGKMAVMHPVPLPSLPVKPPWHDSLEGVVRELGNAG